MAIEKLDRRTVSRDSSFGRLFMLPSVLGCAFIISGCGDSSSTPQETSDTSGGSDSAEVATADTTMSADMSSDSTMDPSTMNQADMQQSMEHGADESFADTTLAADDTSTDVGFSETDPASTTTDPATDPNALAMREAELANSATGDTLDPATAGTVDPNEAAMRAAETSTDPAIATSNPNEAAMLAAGTVDPAAATDPSSFGTEGEGTAPSANGNGGAGQAQEPPADSPDYAAFKVVMGLMQGKHDGLKEYVSTTGRGLIEKIRTGSLTTAEKDDLKKTFAQPQLVGQPRTIRGSRTVNLNSGGQLISVVSKKQGSDWKVSSITIRAAKRR